MTFGGDLPDWTRRQSVQDDVVLINQLFTSGATDTIDVAPYNSIQVTPTRAVATGAELITVAWLDTLGNLIKVDQSTGSATLDASSFTVPVRATQAMIVNQGADDVTIVVLGTQRVTPAYQGIATTPVNALNNPSQLYAGGSNTLLGDGIGRIQGWAHLDFHVNGTAIAGELFCQYTNVDGTAVAHRLTSTAEAVIIGGNQIVTRTIILPAVSHTISFLCRTGGTNIVGANFIALGV